MLVGGRYARTAFNSRFIKDSLKKINSLLSAVGLALKVNMNARGRNSNVHYEIRLDENQSKHEVE